MTPPDLHDPYDDDFDDDAFLHDWDEAEAETAAALRRDLAAHRQADLRPAVLDEARGAVTSSLAAGDPALTWLAQAAAVERGRLQDPDTATLVELIAGSIAMVEESQLPDEEASAVMAVELADWIAVVEGLVRAGPGAQAEPEDLVALVESDTAGDWDELDDGDVAVLELAFSTVVAAWHSAGVVDRDRRLTEAGAWLLPRAACRAWSSDFDEVALDPASVSWEIPLREEPAELDPEEARVVAAAVTALAAGPVTVDDLASRVSAELDTPITDLKEFRSLLWTDPDVMYLQDDRVVAMSVVSDGTAATHRLTVEEVALGVLATQPDLAHTVWWSEEVPLLAGGTVGIRYPSPRTVELPAALVGPPGWLGDAGAGDLVAVERRDGEVSVRVVEEGDLDEEASERTAARLAETFEVLGRENIVGRDLDLPELLLEALARSPKLLATPQRPLGELVERAGLAVTGGAVHRIGERPSGPHDLDPDEMLRAVYGLDDAEIDAYRGVLAMIAMVAEEGLAAVSSDDLIAVAEALADARTAEAVADAALGELSPHSDTLADAAARQVPARRTAGVAYLQARCAESEGRTEDGEAHLRAALAADAHFRPALFDAAWYAEDRGDAQGALTLLRRAGVHAGDAQLVRLERWAQPAPGRNVGRNEPCPCGSGRKYKVCCQQRGGHSLTRRAGWLLSKAITHVERSAQRAYLLPLVEVLAGDARDPERLSAALRDPLIPDLALFEDKLLLDFLEDRGPLLPADELDLGRSWVGIPRSLFEVVAVRPGEGMTLLDLRAGERVDVTERAGSRELHAGDAIFSRVLPAGTTNMMTGAALQIPVQHRESLLELLDTDPDAFAQLAWISAAQRPPDLVTMEGEPTVLCEAVYEVDDPDAARTALNGQYSVLDTDTWGEHFEDGPGGWLRGTLTLHGNRLLLSTNSVKRLERFTDTLHNLLPSAKLVDETRRPVGDVMGTGHEAARESAAVPPEVQAVLDEHIRAYEASWVDESIPALGGLTPRQAADDPTRRGQLLALLAEMESTMKNAPGAGMDADRVRRLLGM